MDSLQRLASTFDLEAAKHVNREVCELFSEDHLTKQCVANAECLKKKMNISTIASLHVKEASTD